MRFEREHLGFGLCVLVGLALLGVATVTPYAPAPPDSAGRSPAPFRSLGGLLVVAGCAGLVASLLGSRLA